ncbi:MAG: hypothetical protein BAA02_05450 [Paenibacillaceae bacterium ZCTH02-B3]|nr:MAG: hypothetical protein BAA02_05450 [Paenibacillaceae bacterium ZCTH02-B3]
MAETVIIADDLTGGNACGIAFARQGFRVLSVPAAFANEDWRDWDVLTVNTETRERSPEEAYESVRRACANAKKTGARFLFKQNDSAMRGHVGAELAAALEGSGERCAVFVPACPGNGRVTRNGIHYVNGKPCKEADIGWLAAYPPASSSIAECIRPYVRVSLLDLGIVRGPERRLRETLAAFRERGGIIVADAEEDRDVRRIAQVVASMDFSLAGGSYVFAGELAGIRRPSAGTPCAHPVGGPSDANNGVSLLLAIGSLSERTKRQIAEALQTGAFVLKEIDVKEDAACGRMGEIMEAARRCYAEGKHLILVPERPASHPGTAIKDSGRQVADRFAAFVAELLDRTGCWSGLVLSGGETASAVLKALATKGIVLHEEVFPTCPRGTILGGIADGMPVVLKAGDWGNFSALIDIAAHMAGTTCRGAAE